MPKCLPAKDVAASKMKKLLRQVLRFADQQGRPIESGYSRWENDEYRYHARVHGNWHAGGYVYFATVERKQKGRWKKMFDGRWDTWNDVLEIYRMIEGDWQDRVTHIIVPQ